MCIRDRPIYHTNVMMCVATDYAVVCLDSIDDVEEREQVCQMCIRDRICQCINMLMWQYVNMPIDRVLFRMAIGISAHGHIDTLLMLQLAVQKKI